MKKIFIIIIILFTFIGCELELNDQTDFKELISKTDFLNVVYEAKVYYENADITLEGQEASDLVVEKFRAAIDIAIKMIEDDTMTEYEMNESIKDLESAIQEFIEIVYKEIDLSDLEYIIEEAKALYTNAENNIELYNAEDIEKFMLEINAAESIVNLYGDDISLDILIRAIANMEESVMLFKESIKTID